MYYLVKYHCCVIKCNMLPYIFNNEMLLCLKYFRMMKISEQIWKLVVIKMLDGCSQVNVTEHFKIHQTSVRYIFQKYLKTSEIDDAKRSGRPWKTTKRQRRLLCKTARNNPFWTAAGNMWEVSLNTIKSYLRQNNLHGRVATK